MAKVLATFLVVMALALSGAAGLQAQTRKPPPKKEEKTSPIGFGFNIGNIRFGNNSFEFGLSPNVAYRFSESVAAGFMLKLQYVNLRRISGTDLHFNGVDFGPTLFTRWKPLWTAKDMTPFLRGLFVQAEYEHAFTSVFATDEFGNYLVKGDRIRTDYIEEDYFYVGLGASSGYPFGTFVSIHYNLLDRYDLSRDPWDFRIGFTWNY